jgi:hypothetical protein
LSAAKDLATKPRYDVQIDSYQRSDHRKELVPTDFGNYLATENSTDGYRDEEGREQDDPMAYSRFLRHLATLRWL